MTSAVTGPFQWFKSGRMWMRLVSKSEDKADLVLLDASVQFLLFRAEV